MENDTSSHPPNTGIIIPVGASVVNVRFDHHLPPGHSLLRANDAGAIAFITEREPLGSTDKRSAESRLSTIKQGRTALAAF